MTEVAAANDEVRAWAAEQGLSVPVRGRIPTAVRRAWEDAHPPEPQDEDDEGQAVEETPPRLLLVDDGPPVDGPRDGVVMPDQPAAPATQGETPPRARKRGIGALRERAARRSDERAATRKRSSVARVVGGAWSMAARVMATEPSMLPVSRVLSLQAPVAGALVDGMVKGSLVDRLLQPLARAGDRGEAVFALVAPPMLVTIIARDPDGLGPLLLPWLREALESWVDIAGPEIKRQQKRAEARRESGIDVDQLIAALFAPPGAEQGQGAAGAGAG